MILYLIYGFGMVTCTVSPLSRFTVRLRIFHVCRNENFHNSYLSFYWKKWFYIWYMALALWLVPRLPFPGLLRIYFLFTVRLTNERVGVFLARRSVQHLVVNGMNCHCVMQAYKPPQYNWNNVESGIKHHNLNHVHVQYTLCLAFQHFLTYLSSSQSKERFIFLVTSCVKR